jgi:putative transposase
MPNMTLRRRASTFGDLQIRLTLKGERQWISGFVDWYNHEHRHSGIGFVTPTERHAGHDRVLLEQRRAVYASAKAKHPQRWGKRKVREREYQASVLLNPLRCKTPHPTG